MNLSDPRLDRNTLLFAAGMLAGAIESMRDASDRQLLAKLHRRLIEEVSRRVIPTEVAPHDTEGP